MLHFRPGQGAARAEITCLARGNGPAYRSARLPSASSLDDVRRYRRVEAWVSPILVRPVREQLEHDRIIRLLQSKNRRRFDVGMNPGAEQNAPVGSGASAVYPDLVFHSLERGRRLEAVAEVETGESVNHLEALAEWAHFSRLRAAFHLYLPASMVDVGRRLCEDNQIHVHEIWSYHLFGDEVRFALVHRSREQPPAARPVAAKPAPGRKASPVTKPSARRPKAAAPVRKPAKATRAAKSKAAKKPVRTAKRK